MNCVLFFYTPKITKSQQHAIQYFHASLRDSINPSDRYPYYSQHHFNFPPKEIKIFTTQNEIQTKETWNKQNKKFTFCKIQMKNKWMHITRTNK